MATHIQRFIALVTAMDGEVPDNRRLEEISADIISYRRDQVEAAGFDPENLTNDQKASVVLDAYAHHYESINMAMLNRRIASRLKAA